MMKQRWRDTSGTQIRCNGAGIAGALALQVIDSETGKAMNDSVRTSSGFYYDVGEDEARPSLRNSAVM